MNLIGSRHQWKFLNIFSLLLLQPWIRLLWWDNHDKKLKEHFIKLSLAHLYHLRQEVDIKKWSILIHNQFLSSTSHCLTLTKSKVKKNFFLSSCSYVVRIFRRNLAKKANAKLLWQLPPQFCWVNIVYSYFEPAQSKSWLKLFRYDQQWRLLFSSEWSVSGCLHIKIIPKSRSFCRQIVQVLNLQNLFLVIENNLNNFSGYYSTEILRVHNIYCDFI